MPFTPEQSDKIVRALNPKIVNPCPVCAQAGTRQLQPDLALLTLGGAAQSPPPPPTSVMGLVKRMPPPGTPTLPLPYPIALPCAVLVCKNCGHTELFNIHVLNLAKELGIPVQGAPIG